MRSRIDNGAADMRHLIHRIGFFRFIGLTVSRVVIVLIFAVLLGGLVMALWNWLLPPIFGLTKIGFLQSVGILILTKLLFSGIPRHDLSRRDHHMHQHMMMHRHHFANRADNDDWMPDGDYKNWRYYRQYWKEQGKENFQEYLRNLKKTDDNISG